MCMVTNPVVATGVAPTPTLTNRLAPETRPTRAPTPRHPPAPTARPFGSTPAAGPGSDSAVLSRRELEDILFDTCTGCHSSQARAGMSSIPHGVLAARAISSNNAKRLDPGRSEMAFEDPPLKYNSKLMNSIWGLYNRYSVHNFKKNTDGEADSNRFGSQQPVLMATAVTAPLNGALLESLCLQ